jgi:hypothetical protein
MATADQMTDVEPLRGTGAQFCGAPGCDYGMWEAVRNAQRRTRRTKCSSSPDSEPPT